MMRTCDSQPFQIEDRQPQRERSTTVRLGRFTKQLEDTDLDARRGSPTGGWRGAEMSTEKKRERPSKPNSILFSHGLLAPFSGHTGQVLVEVADNDQVRCRDIRLHVKETATIRGNRNPLVHGAWEGATK